MPKTPLLLETRQRLRELGDQLWCSCLAQELLAQGARLVLDNKGDVLAAAAFPNSKKAPRINIRVSELARFSERTLATGLGAVITAAYEVCESYCSELPVVLQRLGAREFGYEKRQVPEETLRTALETAGVSPIPAEVFLTFKYLRLRRNQIAHLREEPTDELATLVRQRGTHLMRYWGHEGALDFSAVPRPTLTEQEAMEIHKFLRICVEEIDMAASVVLDVRKVLAELDQAIQASHPTLRGPGGQPRRAQKLEAMVEILYGFDIRPAEISALLWPRPIAR